MQRLRMTLVVGIVLAAAAVALPAAQPFPPSVQQAINQLTTGVISFATLGVNAGSYLNWGTARGESGYGIRDSNGELQVKSSGGSWAPFAPPGGLAPADARYITQTTSAGLTNEQALSALPSALLVNTTTTGVLTTYAGASCTNQVVRVLSVLGAATCQTITSSYVDGSIALTGSTLAQFAATTSAQLAGVISDETGTGALVFGTTPTLTTPTIADFTNAGHSHQNAAGGGQLTDGAISGAIGAAKGGTGLNTSATTGVAQVAAGIWSITTTLQNAVQDAITRTGTVTSGTWSSGFGVVSGANLTNLTAANITGVFGPIDSIGRITNSVAVDAITAASFVNTHVTGFGMLARGGTAANYTFRAVNHDATLTAFSVYGDGDVDVLKDFTTGGTATLGGGASFYQHVLNGSTGVGLQFRRTTATAQTWEARVDSDRLFRVMDVTAGGSDYFSLTQYTTAVNVLNLANASAGTGSGVSYRLTNDQGLAGALNALASTYSTSATDIANSVALKAFKNGGIVLAAEQGSAPVRVYAGGTTLRTTFDWNGDIYFGSITSQPVGASNGKSLEAGNAYAMRSSVISTANQTHIAFYNGNGNVGSITTSASATAYSTSSDYRLKQDVTALTGALARLVRLKPRRFAFHAAPDERIDGFLAHEAAAVAPYAVTGTKDAIDARTGAPIYQQIDHSKLVPLLTAAVQELLTRVEALEQAAKEPR